MKKINRYFVGFGSMMAIAAPVVLAVSCDGQWNALDTKQLDDFMNNLKTKSGSDHNIFTQIPTPTNNLLAIDKDFKDMTIVEKEQTGLTIFNPQSLGAPLGSVLHIESPSTPKTASSRNVTFSISDATGLESFVKPVTIAIPIGAVVQHTPEELLDAEQTRVNTELESGISMSASTLAGIPNLGTTINAGNKDINGFGGLTLNAGFTYTVKTVPGKANTVVLEVTSGSTTRTVVPAEVVVTTTNLPLSARELADELAKITPVVLGDDPLTGIGSEYFELDFVLPSSIGMSTPVILNGIESSVRVHIGQNTNNDDPNAPYGFGIGTWPSTTGGADDHIEIHLTRGTQWDLIADKTLIDSLIAYIKTL